MSGKKPAWQKGIENRESAAKRFNKAVSAKGLEKKDRNAFHIWFHKQYDDSQRDRMSYDDICGAIDTWKTWHKW